MKVHVYPADLHGCGHFRLIWAAKALKAAGHDVTIAYPQGSNVRDAFGRPELVNTLQGRMDKDGNTIDASYPQGVDVMVMQRITHQNLAQSVKLWRSRGIAVVIDIDDDLSAIHPSNPAFEALHPKGSRPKFGWQHAINACEDATLVTVSTPALLDRYARHGRGFVIPNCVPESYLKLDGGKSESIGWGGSVPTHPDDLHTVGSAVAQVVGESGWEFKCVGPPNGLQDALRLQAVPWSATGGVPIYEWPKALADNIGVGIAPLADTIFNAAKSGLKPLEYAALGIACVMSPRADYVRLHEAGIGLLADKPKEWVRQLRSLVTDKTLREDLAGRSRHVAAQWTIEGNVHRWWQAWTYARQLQDLSVVASMTVHKRGKSLSAHS